MSVWIMREENQIHKQTASCCDKVAGFNFVGKQKEKIDALEKQRKWEYSGELKQPTAFLKAMITHSAVKITDKINT